VNGDAVIEFRIDSRSGVAPFRQIVQQVRQAVRLGMLHAGDQLPTVKEVAAQAAINPNTVLKAYRELEHEGLAVGRPGLGTFITRSVGGDAVASHKRLQTELRRWLRKARAAGLDDDSITALFETTVRASTAEEVA
jgi:GntR family transcriptional regulator